MWCADGDICNMPNGKNWLRHPGSNLVLGASQDKNRWIIHAPNDDRQLFSIAPGKGTDNWNWNKSVWIDKDSNVNLPSNLQVSGKADVVDRNTHVSIQDDWGGVSIKNPQGTWTHFGHKHGGRNNWIRGDTQVDGVLNVSSGRLKLGNWLIFEHNGELMIRKAGGHPDSWPIAVFSTGRDRIKIPASHVNNSETEILGNKFFYVNRDGGSGVWDAGWDSRHMKGLPTNY